MNQLQGMRDTIALMESCLQQIAEGGDQMGEEKMHIDRLDASLQPGHLRNMLRMMESGVNPQDTQSSFDDDKMGRWLGWAQAAVVAMGMATLDDMKRLNQNTYVTAAWAEVCDRATATFTRSKTWYFDAFINSSLSDIEMGDASLRQTPLQRVTFKFDPETQEVWCVDPKVRVK